MHFSKLATFCGLAIAGVHAAPGGGHPGGHNPPPPPPPPPTVNNNQQTVHCGSSSDPYCCSSEYPWDPSKCVAIDSNNAICSQTVVCCDASTGGIAACLTNINQNGGGGITINFG
ncbi:uncharacterized protein N7458_007502 [Penicillium daleae]|uniref:Hydrophobin n=1 Tax=Penicillium daleae TaxID=63821 RepID=A0AAD6C309_9EURO|nr:uncharacterized protein N7458_007502 [Penicillium daleae]KAJ5443630.1 hypothetical protein N7458_007502 [Penicillium daleae]